MKNNDNEATIGMLETAIRDLTQAKEWLENDVMNIDEIYNYVGTACINAVCVKDEIYSLTSYSKNA